LRAEQAVPGFRCAPSGLRLLNLTQEEFAARLHLPLGTVRDWEQGTHRPDKAAQVLLTVIARDPDAVARAPEG
jgi:putative transcriptional regulator